MDLAAGSNPPHFSIFINSEGYWILSVLLDNIWNGIGSDNFVLNFLATFGSVSGVQVQNPAFNLFSLVESSFTIPTSGAKRNFIPLRTFWPRSVCRLFCFSE